MKCSRCGFEIVQGRLYCDHCGQEVQWVPDFNPLENIISEQARIEEKKRLEQELLQKKKEKIAKEKKKKRILLFSAFFCCILVLIGIKFIYDQKNYNSFSYQMNRAYAAYTNQDWEKALEYTDRAISLKTQDVEANLLLANIMKSKKDIEAAIRIMEGVIENHPDSEEAYRSLLSLYESQQMTGEIKELMDNCQDEALLSKFSTYIVDPPIAGLSSGTYTYIPKIDFYTKDGSTIYYTTDNSTPDKTSKIYVTPFSIDEGITHIKAIAINQLGITSDVVSFDYTITIPIPDPPVIAPSSGEFITDTKIQISVPQGCTAYYAFDEEPTTDSSLYEGPIDMPEGEHIFKAILVDANGKTSYVASETYVLR